MKFKFLIGILFMRFGGLSTHYQMTSSHLMKKLFQLYK